MNSTAVIVLVVVGVIIFSFLFLLGTHKLNEISRSEEEKRYEDQRQWEIINKKQYK